MSDCVHRNQLVKEWNEAVLSFSKAVSLLKASNANGVEFAKQYHITEEARLHAENARLTLELHRTEHGFERIWLCSGLSTVISVMKFQIRGGD
jgi:hypothetical protein